MSYKVVFTEKVRKQMKKFDRHTAALILGWIEKNLQGCEDPRNKGKGLTSNRSGQWRYRIGNYRLICQIEDNELIILALSVGHRSEVYEGK